MGLSSRVSQLPMTALSIGLQAWERTRGLREFALRRGNEALQIAAHTPLGRLLPQHVSDDGADEEAARIVADARSTAAARPQTAPVKNSAPATSTPAAKASTPAKAAPAKPPAAATAAAREVGAPGAAAPKVEQIAEQLHVQAPEHRDELPIPDFDNISIGSLRARLRPLTIEQLIVLRDWEQAHANRLQVVTTLDNRIAKLSAEQQPRTGGGGDYPQEAVSAEQAAEQQGGTLRV